MPIVQNPSGHRYYAHSLGAYIEITDLITDDGETISWDSDEVHKRYITESAKLNNLEITVRMEK